MILGALLFLINVLLLRSTNDAVGIASLSQQAKRRYRSLVGPIGQSPRAEFFLLLVADLPSVHLADWILMAKDALWDSYERP